MPSIIHKMLSAPPPLYKTAFTTVFPQADNSHTAGVYYTALSPFFPASSYLSIGSHSFPLNLCEAVHPWSQVLLCFICFACKGLTTTVTFNLYYCSGQYLNNATNLVFSLNCCSSAALCPANPSGDGTTMSDPPSLTCLTLSLLLQLQGGTLRAQDPLPSLSVPWEAQSAASPQLPSLL